MKPPISPDINGRVNSANLALSDRRFEEELEIRMAHLSEIALDTVLTFAPKELPAPPSFESALGGDLARVREYYLESLSPPLDHEKTALRSHISALAVHDRLAEECDRVYFSKKLLERIGEQLGASLTVDSFFGSAFGSSADQKPTVRLVANADMKKACSVLIPSDEVELIYSDSIEDSCREAADEGSYAIIPFQNSRDGVLRLFASLICRYGLRIHASCRVGKNDGADFTDFVLASPDGIHPSLPCKNDEWRYAHIFFKLPASASDYSAVSRLAVALSSVEAEIRSIDMPSPQTGKEALVHLVSFDENNACAILAYLSLFVGNHDSIVGVCFEN